MNNVYTYIIAFFLLVFVMQSCEDSSGDKVAKLTPMIQEKITHLQKSIENKELKNIKILSLYVQKAADISPQQRDLIALLAKDATIENPNFVQYKQRFKDYPTLPSTDAQQAELVALSNALSPTTYDQTLIDTINVISDLTLGVLPKLSAPDNKVTKPGSQLVGNPAYGNWQSSNGQSMWVWYGQYRLFSDLMGSRYSYHSWYYNRPWSFYNDYGRNIYGSRQHRESSGQLRQANDQNIKQYGQRTGRHPSSYATRTNQRYTPKKTVTRGRASTYSASHRGRFTSRSFGGFGGK